MSKPIFIIETYGQYELKAKLQVEKVIPGAKAIVPIRITKKGGQTIYKKIYPGFIFAQIDEDQVHLFRKIHEILRVNRLDGVSSLDEIMARNS